MKRLWKKLLCNFGIHQWNYNEDGTKRWCIYCGTTQELWCGIFWEECIDGEPIR